MKLSVRLIVVLFCAALVISMPFFLSSPSMLSEAREALTDSQEEDDGGVDLDFGRLFMPYAMAEDSGLVVEELEPHAAAGARELARGAVEEALQEGAALRAVAGEEHRHGVLPPGVQRARGGVRDEPARLGDRPDAGGQLGPHGARAHAAAEDLGDERAGDAGFGGDIEDSYGCHRGRDGRVVGWSGGPVVRWSCGQAVPVAWSCGLGY